MCATRLVLIAVVLACAGCANNRTLQSEVRHAERALGTDTADHEFQYHVGAEDRQTLGLAFEGVLLSFEKAPRQILFREDLGTSASSATDVLPSDECTAEDLRGKALQCVSYEKEVACGFMHWNRSEVDPVMPRHWAREIAKRLDDKNRLFLSQVFRSEHYEEPTPYFDTTIKFNVYPSVRHLAAPTRKDKEAEGWLGLVRCPPPGTLSSVNDAMTFDDRRCRIDKSVARHVRADGFNSIMEYGLEYMRSDQGLIELLAQALTPAKRQPYTHIIVISMGWNTHQLESVQNFNSVVRHVLTVAATEQTASAFRPLVVGLTWPSAWTFETGLSATARRMVSVANKAYDADELSLTWYAMLLHRTLPAAIAKAKKTTKAYEEKPPRIVTIGHSYGARALSGAEAMCPLYRSLKECAETQNGVDLFVSLNGAYGRARYFPVSDDGENVRDGEPLEVPLIFRDGAPHQPYRYVRDRARDASWHVLMWSTWDSATSIGIPPWTSGLVGGSRQVCSDAKRIGAIESHFIPCGPWLSDAYRTTDESGRVQEHQSRARAIAEHACMAATKLVRDNGEKCVPVFTPSHPPDKPTNLVTLFTAAKQASEMSRSRNTKDMRFDGQRPIEPDRKVVFLDTSGIVRHTTPLHGGNAHSDIYKWEVGYAIWQAIKTFAPAR